jgi:hypothetical protein
MFDGCDRSWVSNNLLGVQYICLHTVFMAAVTLSCCRSGGINLQVKMLICYVLQVYSTYLRHTVPAMYCIYNVPRSSNDLVHTIDYESLSES